MASLSEFDAAWASADVLILGGGISGLTTACVVQALGLHACIVTDYVPDQSTTAPPYPFVATDYAMASAYPHNLLVRDLPTVSADSQAVFKHLEDSEESGVSRYRMFEVFEAEPESAPLGDNRINFQTFSGTAQSLARSVDPPVRPDADYLWGWSFDTYFADMPTYMPFLWQHFLSHGGTKVELTLAPETLDSLPSGIPAINCLGIAARQIFADSTPANIMRGIQVIVENQPLLRKGSLPLAYNYTPSADVYSRADGLPEYVHFFARTDGWLLGQTREPGHLDEFGHWCGAPVAGDLTTIAGEKVPTPILSLNQSILKNWLDCQIDFELATLIPRLGYRYYRDPATTGVRLEAEQKDNRLFIHNYGHGGSGITMSWGCALACARLLKANTDITWQPTNGSSFNQLIKTLV